ncbi:unnamed protein product, partial [Pylaiella littoralis]
TSQHTHTRQPKHRRICNLEGPRISSQGRLYWKDARAFPADKISAMDLRDAMGVGDDTVGGVQDAPFSPVRRGPIFTKETIGGDDANSMDTDED